jgi:MFS family permease
MSASRRSALLGPVLVLATLVASIISSLGAPLIPTVARDFHESLSTAQWSLTVALLSGAVSSPVLGRLGDGPRRRQTMIGGLVVVAAGGVVAALATGLETLVIGRALQGVGLGLVPLAMATARDELPEAKVPPMIALLSVSAAAGIGAGYPISGLIAETWGLAGAFWFGAIVCGFALVCVAAVVPSSAGRSASSRLDWVGAGLLAVALIATLVGVAQGSDWGWGSPATIGLLVAGVVLFTVWAVHQVRTPAPLVEVRLLRHPAVLAGDACAIVLGIAMYMLLSGVTEFVQTPRSAGFGFSASAVVAGLVLIPLSVFMLTGSRTLPTLVKHLGVRAVLAVGCLVVAVSTGFFAVFHGALWEAFVMMGILGVGLGTTFAAIPGLIVQAVPAHETGSAMGFYQVVRYVGFSTGSALTASILAARATGNDQPTLGGYTTVLWVSSGICVVAAALAWFLSARSSQVAPAERLPAEEVRLLERTDGDDLIADTSRPDRDPEGVDNQSARLHGR